MKKQAQTPAKVVQLVHSSRTSSLDDLASKAKELTRLTTDFGIETCVVCCVKDRPYWQVTLFDDSWGFLCGSCGEKVCSKLNKSE